MILIIGLGLLSALLYARRQLNSRSYVVSTTVCLIGIASVGGLAKVNEHGLKESIPQILVAIYLIRVLIDYYRLAVSKHIALNVSHFQLANEVSTILKKKRSHVPLVHTPTNPVRAFFFAILFVLSILGLFVLSFIAASLSNGQSQLEPSQLENAGMIGSFLPLVANIGIWIWLAVIAALARRHYVLRADRALQLDNRSPILFLRSFADDKVRLWGRGIAGKFRRKTIDEAAKRFAENLGPFIAIANPKANLPHLGAAQIYVSNDTWQGAIARWVQMAEMILMVAGRTEGIRWELDHIFSNEGHAKLVIFLPPALRKDPATTSGWFQNHFSQTKYAQDISAIDLRKTIAIAFREDGLFVVETQRIRKREVDYIVAMQAIIFGTHRTRKR